MDPKPILTDKELATLVADPRLAETLPPVLSIDHIAEFLGVPRSTVYAWSSQGRLDVCKFRAGKHARFVRIKFLELVLNGGLNVDK